MHSVLNAGIHRIIGVPLSKVRSLRMDQKVWGPYLIQVTQALMPCCGQAVLLLLNYLHVHAQEILYMAIIPIAKLATLYNFVKFRVLVLET